MLIRDVNNASSVPSVYILNASISGRKKLLMCGEEGLGAENSRVLFTELLRVLFRKTGSTLSQLLRLTFSLLPLISEGH